jgi:hypothetical protein
MMEKWIGNRVIWSTTYQIVFNRMNLGNMMILYTLLMISYTLEFLSDF